MQNENTVVVDVSKGLITVKHADGSETTQEVVVKEQVITKPIANVGYSAQITKNMGNYESAKISVSLYVPTEISDLEDNFSFVTGWVDNKINSLIASINS